MRQKDQGSRKTEIKTKKVKEEGKKEPKRSKIGDGCTRRNKLRAIGGDSGAKTRARVMKGIR